MVAKPQKRTSTEKLEQVANAKLSKDLKLEVADRMYMTQSKTKGKR